MKRIFFGLLLDLFETADVRSYRYYFLKNLPAMFSIVTKRESLLLILDWL